MRKISNHSSSFAEEEEQDNEIETSDLELNDGEIGTGSADLPTVTAETSEAAAIAHTEGQQGLGLRQS